MTITARIRTLHRWIALAFMAAVATYTVMIMTQGKAPGWMNAVTLTPLFLLMASGLWMLIAHYAGRSRGERPVRA
jgi:hypothetical protein